MHPLMWAAWVLPAAAYYAVAEGLSFTTSSLPSPFDARTTSFNQSVPSDQSSDTEFYASKPLIVTTNHGLDVSKVLSTGVIDVRALPSSDVNDPGYDILPTVIIETIVTCDCTTTSASSAGTDSIETGLTGTDSTPLGVAATDSTGGFTEPAPIDTGSISTSFTSTGLANTVSTFSSIETGPTGTGSSGTVSAGVVTSITDSAGNTSTWPSLTDTGISTAGTQSLGTVSTSVATAITDSAGTTSTRPILTDTDTSTAGTESSGTVSTTVDDSEGNTSSWSSLTDTDTSTAGTGSSGTASTSVATAITDSAGNTSTRPSLTDTDTSTTGTDTGSSSSSTVSGTTNGHTSSETSSNGPISSDFSTTSDGGVITQTSSSVFESATSTHGATTNDIDDTPTSPPVTNSDTASTSLTSTSSGIEPVPAIVGSPSSTQSGHAGTSSTLDSNSATQSTSTKLESTLGATGSASTSQSDFDSTTSSRGDETSAQSASTSSKPMPGATSGTSVIETTSSTDSSLYTQSTSSDSSLYTHSTSSDSETTSTDSSLYTHSTSGGSETTSTDPSHFTQPPSSSPEPIPGFTNSVPSTESAFNYATSSSSTSKTVPVGTVSLPAEGPTTEPPSTTFIPRPEITGSLDAISSDFEDIVPIIFSWATRPSPPRGTDIINKVDGVKGKMEDLIDKLGGKSHHGCGIKKRKRGLFDGLLDIAKDAANTVSDIVNSAICAADKFNELRNDILNKNIEGVKQALKDLGSDIDHPDPKSDDNSDDDNGSNDGNDSDDDPEHSNPSTSHSSSTSKSSSSSTSSKSTSTSTSSKTTSSKTTSSKTTSSKTTSSKTTSSKTTSSKTTSSKSTSSKSTSSTSTSSSCTLKATAHQVTVLCQPIQITSGDSITFTRTCFSSTTTTTTGCSVTDTTTTITTSSSTKRPQCGKENCADEACTGVGTGGWATNTPARCAPTATVTSWPTNISGYAVYKNEKAQPIPTKRALDPPQPTSPPNRDVKHTIEPRMPRGEDPALFPLPDVHVNNRFEYVAGLSQELSQHGRWMPIIRYLVPFKWNAFPRWISGIIGIKPLTGCTAIVIVCNKGAYTAYLYETPVFVKKGGSLQDEEEFRSYILDLQYARPGRGTGSLVDLVGTDAEPGALHRSNRPLIFIVTPFAPDGHLMFADRVAWIARQFELFIYMDQLTDDSRSIIKGYHPVSPEVGAAEFEARGRVMLEATMKHRRIFRKVKIHQARWRMERLDIGRWRLWVGPDLVLEYEFFDPNDWRYTLWRDDDEEAEPQPQPHRRALDACPEGSMLASFTDTATTLTTTTSTKKPSTTSTDKPVHPKETDALKVSCITDDFKPFITKPQIDAIAEKCYEGKRHNHEKKLGPGDSIHFSNPVPVAKLEFKVEIEWEKGCKGPRQNHLDPKDELSCRSIIHSSFEKCPGPAKGGSVLIGCLRYKSYTKKLGKGHYWTGEVPPP